MTARDRCASPIAHNVNDAEPAGSPQVAHGRPSEPACAEATDERMRAFARLAAQAGKSDDSTAETKAFTLHAAVAAIAQSQLVAGISAVNARCAESKTGVSGAIPRDVTKLPERDMPADKPGKNAGLATSLRDGATRNEKRRGPDSNRRWRICNPLA